MAPIKRGKTYGRGNKSLVNNSVDAFNKLFAKNMAQRVIGKNRKRNYLIKELPSRPRCESMLDNDSFQISIDDTFDKLRKPNTEFHMSSCNKKTLGETEDISKSKSCITQVSDTSSPIMTRRRRKQEDFLNTLSITETTESFDQTHLRRLKEPSEEKVEASLEVERVVHQPTTSFSYITVPDSFETSKLGVSINYFTQNLNQNLLTSTPLFPSNERRHVNHTLSPVRMNSLKHGSFPHTKDIFPNSLSSSKNTPLMKETGSKFKNPNITGLYVFNHSSPDFSICNIIEPVNKRCSHSTPNKGPEYVTMRRNIFKSNAKHFNRRKKLSESFNILTASLESFNNFEQQSLQIHTQGWRQIDLFKSSYSPVNFVTQRKNSKNQSLIHSNSKLASDESLEFNNENKRVFKDLLIKIPRKEVDLCNLRSELQFDNFYSKNISLELSKLQNDFEIKEKNEGKNMSLACFEQFYNTNYISVEDSSTNEENSTSDLIRGKSLRENDGLIKPPNQMQETFDDKGGSKNTKMKELKVNITLRSLRSHKTDSLQDHSEIDSLNQQVDISKDNTSYLSIQNGEVSNTTPDCAVVKNVRINLINNNFNVDTEILSTSSDNSLIQTSGYVSKKDSRSKEFNEHKTADCVTDNSNTEINLTPKVSRNAIDSNTNSKVQDEILVNNTTKTTGFEIFYKDHYNVYDMPLPTVAVPDISDNIISINSDVIESSIVEVKNTVVSNNKKTKTSKIVSKKKNMNATLHTPEKSVNHIIPSSALSNGGVDKDSFKMPITPLKTIQLKRGKSWRRSLAKYKRKSSLGIQECCSPYLAKFCPKGRHSSRPSVQSFTRRSSIRLVPLVHLQNDKSSLQEYALNTSYERDRNQLELIEDHLEDSLKCLSLNQRNLSKNRSRLSDQVVPVTAKDIVLRRCGQTEPLEFSKCFPDSALQNCHKIGEGVYGEVFLLKNPNGGTSVLKIVPVEGDQIVNGEHQKKFEEVLSEIIITMELSNLRNNKRNGIAAFTEVQKIQCVQGTYPKRLIELWDLFYETSGTENDCPDIFGEDQLYIIFQMAYGGRDMEAFEFKSAMQAYAMFQQVAIGLAVAEEELHFEHRDLHWGNVLVSTVETNKFASFNIDNQDYQIPTMGVEVAIIDFTLSRIEHDDVVIFNDLSLDPDLFSAEGDYQFEIYRMMQEKNGDNWSNYEPFSNILWLHYILDKAIVALRYKTTKTKRHKDYLRKLQILKEDILSYRSVKEFVTANIL